ncbi:MAG: 50S ribosomal protein L10 [Acidiferrobacterales bacterium]
MSLSLEQKKVLVEKVSAALVGAQAAALAEYRGLTVAQMSALRRSARRSNVFLAVVKNNLARRAVEGSQFECLKEEFSGPLALAVGADPIAVAKVLSDFAKDNEDLRIKAAAVDGALMSSTQFDALAELPGREQLLAMLLSTMTAPIQTFVRVLNEVPSKFVRTLVAVRDSKETASSK